MTYALDGGCKVIFNHDCSSNTYEVEKVECSGRMTRRLTIASTGARRASLTGSRNVTRRARSRQRLMDDSDKKRLKRTCNDIVRETASSKEWTGFPPEAVAIGDNGGGGKLILLPEPGSDRFGDSIFWWDHETGDVNKVVDDFAELLGDVFES